MPAGIPEFKAGDKLKAADLNALVKLFRAGKLYANPPLDLKAGANGFVLSLVRPAEIWARITGMSSGAYSWQQITPGPNGTGVDGVMMGTTSVEPAHEWNGNTTVPTGTRVRMRRGTESGVWLFQLAACQAATQPAPIPPVPPLNNAI